MMRSHWMKGALIVSLAINVAVGAAVVGAVATGGPDREARGGGGPPEMRALIRAMPQQERRALFRTLRADGRLSGGRAARGAARADIIASLRVAPFARADFVAALQAQRDLQADLAAAGIAAMADTIAGLSPADRQAMADTLAADRGGRR